MEFKWKKAEVNVDGSPLQISIPSVKVDDETKKNATKAVVGLALGGVSGVVAIGGAFALDEWGAVRGNKAPNKHSSKSKSRDSTPVGSRTRRCRVQHAKTLTKEAKAAARTERRERERMLMKQMGFDAQLQQAGIEPRGRYQPDSPSAITSGGMGHRSSSLPELGPVPTAGAAAESPSPSPSPMSSSPFTELSDPSPSPREQRRRREKALMSQMAEKRREEALMSSGIVEIPPSPQNCEIAAQMADLIISPPSAPHVGRSSPVPLSIAELQTQAHDLGVPGTNAAADKEQLREMIRAALEQKLTAQPVTVSRLVPGMRQRRRMSRSSNEARSRSSSRGPMTSANTSRSSSRGFE